MFILILSCVISFAMVYSIMPGVIRIAINRNLVARPEERSSHNSFTPCLGGIPIFMGVLFSSLLLTPLDEWMGLQYILSALVIVFMIGTKDDLEVMSARNKAIGLVIAIAILVTRGEIRLASMYHLFGFTGELPYWFSITASAFTLLVITNSFNLIDGIDGLAGTVGTIAMTFFGIWFYLVDMPHLSLLAIATVGGLLAFLRYNISDTRKTFMGDTGALVVGTLLGIMTIEFIDVCSNGVIPPTYRFVCPIGVAVSVLIIPLFDTVRVFSTRIYRGHSPFRPDRRHIHHLLIDSGLSHLSATFLLGFVNLLYIALAFALDGWLDLHYILFIQIGAALGLTYWLHRRMLRYKAAEQLA